MSKPSSSLFALLFGLVAGSILGLLFAPDKGSNTRDKVTYQLDSFKKKLEKLVKDKLQGTAKRENTEKKKGDEVINKTRDKADQILSDVNGIIKKINK